MTCLLECEPIDEFVMHTVSSNNSLHLENLVNMIRNNPD